MIAKIIPFKRRTPVIRVPRRCSIHEFIDALVDEIEKLPPAGRAAFREAFLAGLKDGVS